MTCNRSRISLTALGLGLAFASAAGAQEPQDPMTEEAPTPVEQKGGAKPAPAAALSPEAASPTEEKNTVSPPSAPLSCATASWEIWRGWKARRKSASPRL